MITVEVRSRTGWRRLGPEAAAPQIGESDLFRLRGLPAGAAVGIGDVTVGASPGGMATISLLGEDSLRGHIGAIEVRVEGSTAGYVDVVPDKMSRASYEVLKQELERTWTGLIFDASAIASQAVDLPDPHHLWQRIEGPVRDIALDPRATLVAGTGIRTIDQVRRPGQLTRSLLIAAAQGRPGLTRTVERSTLTPENGMVVETLTRLHAYAGRHPDGKAIQAGVAAVLSRPPFDADHRPVRSITWGMRSDPRYRQVHAVHRLLNRPEAFATTGPGEIRQGVAAIHRLYEYWLYLKVLEQARRLYGPPNPPGFSVLHRRRGAGPTILTLPPGTTVTFPGPVHVAFEPVITAGEDSWMGVEYVPHPDPDRRQHRATPDVVVLAPGTPRPLLILDAKHVGRAFVEADAVRLHDKYARMLYEGQPAVDQVIAVHPHQGVAAGWAGYGHVGLTPGTSLPDLPLPQPAGAEATPPAVTPPPQAAVIADQWWMHQVLGDRRIDLRDLALAAGARTGDHLLMVMPDLPALASFARAAAGRGWTVHQVHTANRPEQIDAILELARHHVDSGHALTVVSGDPTLQTALDRAGIPYAPVSDLGSIPVLGHGAGTQGNARL